MFEAALAGAIAGYAIAIPVGAIAVLIIHAAVTHGLRTGLAAGAGAASADLVYATIAVIVGGAAAALIAGIQAPLQIVAGFFLIGLAVRGFVGLRSAHDPSSAASARSASHSHGRTYLTFLGLTPLNPVTVTYFAALVVGLPNLGGAAERAAFAVAVFVASVSWQSILAVFGAAVGRGSSHRIRLATAIVGNTIVLGFGVLIAARAMFPAGSL
jgi:threonine/homoserine/homoserine lactone efflux protein